MIHKKPDFINEELFFNIMNGVGPDLNLFENQKYDLKEVQKKFHK